MTPRNVLVSVLHDFHDNPDDGCWYTATLYKDDVDNIRAMVITDDTSDDDKAVIQALRKLIVDLPSVPNDSDCYYYSSYDADYVDACRKLL